MSDQIETNETEQVNSSSALELTDEEFAALNEEDYFSEINEISNVSDTEVVDNSIDADIKLPEPKEEEEQEEEGLDQEEEEQEPTEEQEEKEEDYKSKLEELFTPFKANGKEIQVDNIEDARNLMQMGAGYNKKMAALKPHFKILKTLENNGLLDESKLNFLIDLDKKDPEAIKKLIQDSKMDLDEFNPEDKLEYSPKDHSASEQQVELDTVLEKIQDTPSYQRTVDVITKQWDSSSKQELSKSPQLIEVINHHIGQGIYDKVISQVAKEQALGRLANLSDFQAYAEVGKQMMARGEFQEATSKTSQSKNDNPQPSKELNLEKEAERVKRKMDIKPTKTTKTKPKEEFNLLAMSDEEFAKIPLSKYL